MNGNISREFHNDVRERKSLASASKYKKNGSKSKKCSLPSDNLTQKQLREKSGPVVKYNLSKPMDWKTFKSIPTHAQKEFISYLRETYDANATNIADMLGVSTNTLKKHIDEKQLTHPFPIGHRMNPTNRKAWNEFIDKSNVDAEHSDEDVAHSIVEEELCSCCDAKEEVVAVEASERNVSMQEFSVVFSGDINVDMVANSLRSILGNTPQGTLKIRFFKESKD